MALLYSEVAHALRARSELLARELPMVSLPHHLSPHGALLH